jgi:hypothetical protein
MGCRFNSPGKLCMIYQRVSRVRNTLLFSLSAWMQVRGVSRSGSFGNPHNCSGVVLPSPIRGLVHNSWLLRCTGACECRGDRKLWGNPPEKQQRSKVEFSHKLNTGDSA